jgi:CheY-like chemotaxis protein
MQKFDLVVTDLHMPVMNGFELQKQVEEEFNLPVISECHFALTILIFSIALFDAKSSLARVLFV